MKPQTQGYGRSYGHKTEKMKQPKTKTDSHKYYKLLKKLVKNQKPRKVKVIIYTAK